MARKIENQELVSPKQQCSSTPVGCGQWFLSKEQHDNTEESSTLSCRLQLTVTWSLEWTQHWRCSAYVILLTSLCDSADTIVWFCWHHYVILMTSLCDSADIIMWFCWHHCVILLTPLCDSYDTIMWFCWHHYVILLTTLCDSAAIIKNATEQLEGLPQNGFQKRFQQPYCG